MEGRGGKGLLRKGKGKGKEWDKDYCRGAGCRKVVDFSRSLRVSKKIRE